MPGYGVAYGGIPYGQPRDARQVVSGRPVGVPANAVVYAGGVPWVDEPAKCSYSMKDTGWPCSNAPIAGTDHCIGHKRHAAKQELQREGK